MKVISWNVRGSGAASKRALVKDLLQKTDLDLVCLQETKKSEIDMSLVSSIWRTRHIGCLSLDAEDTTEGILLLWNEQKITVTNPVIGVFFITLFFRGIDGKEGWFTGVYGPSSTRGRFEFWRELEDLAGLCQGAVHWGRF